MLRSSTSAILSETPATVDACGTWVALPFKGVNRAAKRSFDVTAAVLLVLALAPLLVAIAGLIWAMQGSPVVIKHKRLGRSGRSFPCYKFRTMVSNGEEVLSRHLQNDPAARLEWETSRKLKADPRVTPLGQVLRKTSVDELPQIINILRGDMSLVGPRPIVEGEVQFYGPAIHDYYRVRPGLTGPWQVSGRSDTSYEHRVKLDVTYANTANVFHDMAILLRTVPAVINARGSY